MTDNYLSYKQYQKKYSVSRSTVDKWRFAGLLTIFQIEKVIRIKDEPPSDGQLRPQMRAAS